MKRVAFIFLATVCLLSAPWASGEVAAQEAIGNPVLVKVWAGPPGTPSLVTSANTERMRAGVPLLEASTATVLVTYDAGFQASPAARAAFQFAVDIWASQVTSAVPILINANWRDLCVDNNLAPGCGILGSAGPRTFVRGYAGLPRSDSWYPIPLANALAGYDIDGSNSDITANFNSGWASWYFGIDGRPASNQIDFVSVVLHELGHGLGFLGFASYSGGLGYVGGSGIPSIWDRFVVNGSGTPILSFANGSLSLGSQLTGNSLYWGGSNGVAAAGGAWPRLYAPTTWASGSSYSHLDEATYGRGNANSLMTPQIGGGEAIHDAGPITLGILRDSGWLLGQATRVVSLGGDLSFGAVPVNRSGTRTLMITNLGTAPLTVTGIACPAGFSGAWSGVIAAGATQGVTVTFAPTAATAYSGILTVSANQTGGSNTIAISGMGAVNASDFNGDGRRDLLWRNSTTGAIVVWFMQGTSVTGERALPTVADPHWQAVALEDFSADGQADVVWRNDSTGQNVIWWMNGATFVSQVSLPTIPDSNWQIVASADMNADRKADLVWRNRTTGQNVVWYLNNSTFLSEALLPPLPDTAWRIVGAADFNADGKPDLLWRNRATGQNLVWYMNGAALVDQALLTTVTDTRWYVGLVADFNQDGQTDIVWRHRTTGQNVVWYLNGVTIIGSAALPPVDTRWDLNGQQTRAPSTTGDFNADGHPDVFWRNITTGQNVVWLMNGATFVEQALLPPVPDTNWEAVAAADFNEDNRPDVVWRNETTGQNVVWYMNGVNFLSQTLLPPVADPLWEIVAAADFNGDGSPDLVWRNRSSGENHVWYMSGVTFVSEALLPPVPDGNWQIVGAGDVDGDRQADLVWRNRTTGQNVVWFMNGATFVSQGVLPPVPDPAWQIAMAVDFNADGKADLAWRNATTGQNVVWYLSGATFLGQVLLPSVADANWVILRNKQ